MNPAQLLAHFDRISEAPDAMPRLRRFILDLAVRGKLVEQDPSDEPASELLKRLQRERETAPKGRVSNRSAQPVGAETGPQPFAVPASWAWTSLGRVAHKLTDGSHNPPANVGAENGFPMLSSQNVLDGAVSFSNPTRYLSSVDFEVENARSQIAAGDVLLTIVGSIGRSAVVPEGVPRFAIQRSLAVVASRLLPAFLSLQLRSPGAQLYFDEHGKGTAQKGIYLGKLARMPIVVPPLAEQHRIVAKVDELMVLCDRLEAAQAERENRRDRLVAASLNLLNQPAEAGDTAATRDHASFHLHHLPRLTTRPEHIQQLRQTILSLAVSGKLVPQDPNDEPASGLLKRVADDARRLANQQVSRGLQAVASVAASDVLHETPNSWAWSDAQGLAQPGQTITYGILKPVWVQAGVPTVRVTEMKTGTIDLGALLKCDDNRAAKFAKTRLAEGDLLISKDGTIGKTAFVPPALAGGNITQHILRFPISRQLDRWFVRICVEAPPCQAWMAGETKGVALQGVNVGDFRRMPIPVPPLAEQHRIVAKVDQLLALCDRLEAQLTTTQTESRRLLEAVLHQALAPVA